MRLLPFQLIPVSSDVITLQSFLTPHCVLLEVELTALNSFASFALVVFHQSSRRDEKLTARTRFPSFLESFFSVLIKPLL